MANKPAVRIPVTLDAENAKREARSFSRDMKRSFQATVDVVQATRLAFEMAGAALGKMSGFAKEAISLAAEQERVEQRLLSVARMRGKFSDADFQALQAQNAARQQALGIGDEEQLQLQSSALLLGARAENLDELTRLSIGLSRVTGENLLGALKKVRKIQAGNLTELNELGIKYSSVSEGIERISQMYEEVSQQTGTFSQQTATLTANWGDFLEELGRTVTESPEVKELLDEMSATVIGWGEYVKNNKAEIRASLKGFLDELRALGTWTQENKDSILLLIQLFAGAKMLGAVAGLGIGKKTVGGLLGGLAITGGKAGAAKAGGALSAMGAGGALALAGGAGLLGGGLTMAAAPRISKAEARVSVGNLAAGIPLGQVQRAAAAGEAWAVAELERRTLPRDYDPAPMPQSGQPEHLMFSDTEGSAGVGGGIHVDRKKLAERQRAAKRQREKEAKRLQAEHREQDRLAREDRRRARRKQDRSDAKQERSAAGFDASWHEASGSFLTMDEQLAWRQQRITDEDQFWGDLTSMGVSGAIGYFEGVAGVLANGEQSMGDAMLRITGGLLSQFGEYLITFGTTALLAANASAGAPMTWPWTGGPVIGSGAALGIIAAGTALTVGGGAVASLAGSNEMAREVSRATARQRRTEQPRMPKDELAPVSVVINFNQPVGSPRRAARAIADVLSRGRTLAPLGA